MNNTINWTKFEDCLGKSIADCQWLLDKAIAENEIKKEILKHKSETAYKAFKKFRRELDRAPLTSNQKIDVLKQFKVIEHL